MNDKVKKMRVTLDVTEDGDRDLNNKFYRATSSTVDKHSGVKRIITSAEASNMRHAIYWGKQNALSALGKKADEVQFLVRKPEVTKPEKKEAKKPVAATKSEPTNAAFKSASVPPPPSASSPIKPN